MSAPLTNDQLQAYLTMVDARCAKAGAGADVLRSYLLDAWDRNVAIQGGPRAPAHVSVTEAASQMGT